MKKIFKLDLRAFFGYIALAVIAIGVMIFLGSHSLEFFKLSMGKDNELFSWLGLLLTSGGVLGWGLIFHGLAQTIIKKGVAIIMMFVAAIGEFATAGFNMYINNMTLVKGFEFTAQEMRGMSKPLTIIIS